jgi:hypothetical protein
MFLLVVVRVRVIFAKVSARIDSIIPQDPRTCNINTHLG